LSFSACGTPPVRGPMPEKGEGREREEERGEREEEK
jgi:hypothetical protein